ncbi:hypothetical protein RJ640_009540 [Escallonia rubra]|uniref:Retrotransposon gag domain-containing protein n=1 Tax=Escallonia rubra TaxID=112253 RepID=A0AA88QHA5_9ASTE|nr:hypothetical protein RJ640_009540 [Escallonia rubra]
MEGEEGVTWLPRQKRERLNDCVDAAWWMKMKREQQNGEAITGECVGLGQEENPCVHAKARRINGGMTSSMMTADEKADLTRKAFQDRFFMTYFPPNVKEAMESNFKKIAQHPNKTITEYEERFVRLSRFALHIIQG